MLNKPVSVIEFSYAAKLVYETEDTLICTVFKNNQHIIIKSFYCT